MVAGFGEQPANDKERQCNGDVEEIEQHSTSKLDPAA
jgi:hypothetical protein